jgi:hypothetical protein
VTARVAAALRARPEVKVRDPVLAALVMQQAVGPLSRWLVHDAPPDLDVEAFVEEAVRMVAGYALGDPA